MSEVLAVDLVLFFDQESEQKLIDVSNSLQKCNLVISKLRRPHLSLCKFLIHKEDIEKITLFSKNFNLLFNSSSEHLESEERTTCLFMKKNKNLITFQKNVVSDLFLYFQNAEITNSLFAEDVNELTMSWLLSAMENVGANFNPHISLGFGKLGEIKLPIMLTTASVVLVHMGNYCSAMKILKTF